MCGAGVCVRVMRVEGSSARVCLDWRGLLIFGALVSNLLEGEGENGSVELDEIEEPSVVVSIVVPKGRSAWFLGGILLYRATDMRAVELGRRRASWLARRRAEARDMTAVEGVDG